MSSRYQLGEILNVWDEDGNIDIKVVRITSVVDINDPNRTFYRYKLYSVEYGSDRQWDFPQEHLTQLTLNQEDRDWDKVDEEYFAFRKI
ncbi:MULTISPECIES: hypothetical protein [unclassified Bacillus (in: firmicutes)]|uniref:hypothetical protein n=1 Tax=unclassified Bacillus (in: firmicutes) TaxID=185979 RepID=UPI0008F38CA1|nr:MULTISPECIES: hypothetical protein [unclassified Bacillus (in: firmicutes)]SFA69448.1 hypothetical protein SAMN02799634_10120 [Bacillus sp. UNCCL13]SFQ58736.1 hypothetical protein SAMN04488577_0303 [Bacillus sp. cl95]